MNLYDKIDLKKIVFNLYKKDVHSLIESKDYKLSEKDVSEIIVLAKTDNLKTLYEGLNNVFEKNLTDDKFELSLMLTLFLQRYHYFFVTENEWKKYSIGIEIPMEINPGTFFLEYVAPFFETQIKNYTYNYLNLIESFNILKWNKKFGQDLINIINDINNKDDFVERLASSENLVKFLQDTKNIYASLEAVGIESEKKEFLAHTNEIKIVFQSMNHIINEILLSIVKAE
ncbi:hypothetical protein [Spiroplasma apis]|uniref:Uncharacterized protein n=1 Tax=Spiroplasma apis B31 TaxID=1276258 RepID=V5RIM9_SPIAP|nr:hypothetical protein [Spiroplasma apis]AHB36419.1 hypothetical protein SAPIS_v1c05740 [Spiroplasma apis B31]